MSGTQPSFKVLYQSGLFGLGWIGGLPITSKHNSLGLFGFVLRHQLIFIMCTREHPGQIPNFRQTLIASLHVILN